MAWTRKRLGEVLGLSRQRTYQLQDEGVLQEPIEEDGVLAWPETYAQAFVATRQGRRTSTSLVGLPPAASPAVLQSSGIVVDDSQGVVRYEVLAVSGHQVVTVQRLRPENSPRWPGQLPRPVFSHWSERALDDFFWRGRLLAVADEVFGGDFTAAVWVVLGDERIFDVVIVDDPSDGPFRTLHHPNGRRTDTLTLHSQAHGFAALSARIGEPVRYFHSSICSQGAIDSWEAAGRPERHLVPVDWDGFQERATAATIIGDLPAIPDSDRQTLLSTLLHRIRWQESGTAVDIFTPPDDARRDPWVVSWQLVPQQPDLSAAHARFAAVAEPAGLGEFGARHLFDLIDELRRHHGPHGEHPAPGIVAALEVARESVEHKRRYEPGGFEDDFEERVPYVLREWTATRVPYRHPLARTYYDSLQLWDGKETEAARAVLARVRELSRHARDQGTVREPVLLRDASGNPVARGEWESFDKPQREYVAAVPVLWKRVDPTDPLRQFESIVVMPDTQKAPVFITTANGVQLMPFGDARNRPFTYGYNGTGPGYLEQAIAATVARLLGPLDPVSERRLYEQVMGGSQGNALVIHRTSTFEPAVGH